VSTRRSTWHGQISTTGLEESRDGGSYEPTIAFAVSVPHAVTLA
jgi:hypothetical protein